jgi:uncharacterized protein
MIRFAGYAAIFDRPDKGGDIVRKGAFAKTLRQTEGERPKIIPLLHQHDTGKRIGAVEHLSEDDHGLRVIAQVETGVAVHPGTGLSFGYRVRGMDQRTYRELTNLDLIEVSVVTHPMQPLARVLAVEPDKSNHQGE